jgi:hypothetical protein
MCVAARWPAESSGYLELGLQDLRFWRGAYGCWARTWSWGEGFSTLEDLLMYSSPGGKCHVAYTVARAAGEIDYDPIIKSDGCKAEPKER